MDEVPGIKVQVNLLIVTNEEGAERLLPRSSTLARNLRMATRNLRVAQSELADAKTDEEKAMIGQRLWLSRNQVEAAQMALEDFADAEKRATPKTYTIRTPDYGTLLVLEESHRTEESGIPRTDMRKLCHTITQSGEFIVGNASPSTTPPSHMRRLWDAWIEEVYPDQEEIPFS